ncbi:ionotropic receptor 93a-like [Panulirus ornatus]|uniref:ionotropic receptor 93a-like n=1 Tax=Panulirus ornatus TaxID=150431 RepID=UPI003A88EEA1
MTVMTVLLADAMAKLLHRPHAEEDARAAAVSAVLEATSQPSCSLILLTDGATSPSFLKVTHSHARVSPWGMTVLDVTKDGHDDANVTLALLSQQIIQARRSQVRLSSWCVRVVVVSHDPAFLVAFAESSLKGRLLVWVTRLLVVTSLTLPQLYTLIPAHWTFSMMNTIFLNLEDTTPNLRYSLYTHLPYSPMGPQVVRVATWSARRDIHLLKGLTLFSEKYYNFHGATVNVAILPWPPYWDEVMEKAPNGTLIKKYSGSDYLVLKAISEVLNFVIATLPITDWNDAARKVQERKAFISPVYHITLPDRWRRHGFTFTYEFVRMSFSLAKPGLKPRWQSLYYPLTKEVWMTMLVVLLFMLIIFYTVSRGHKAPGNRLTMGSVMLEVTGILVGQNLPLRLPNVSSSRLLVAAWLVFAFIIGTVYRGNLTAALTLPKFPPRPETLEELVDAVDRVTMPPFGIVWRTTFAASESEVYRKMAKLLSLGPSVMQGLQTATEQNSAQMTDRRNMEYMIAEHFTQADGSTQLYLGREPIFPGPAGWPIPHDAPFKSQLDRCLMAIVEAGIYEKWSKDTIVETRRKSQRRKRKYLAQQQQQQQQQQVRHEAQPGSGITALTFTHMQGPLMLLILGLVGGGMVYFGEILLMKYKESA